MARPKRGRHSEASGSQPQSPPVSSPEYASSDDSLGYDVEKFTSQAAFDEYKRLMAKTVIKERGFIPVSTDGNLVGMIERMEWVAVCETPPAVSLSIVREFYANAVTPPISVQGIRVVTSSSILIEQYLCTIYSTIIIKVISMHLTPQVIVLELSLTLTKILQYQSISRISSQRLLKVNTVHRNNNQKTSTTSLLDIYIILLPSSSRFQNLPFTALHQLQDFFPSRYGWYDPLAPSPLLAVLLN